MWDPHTHPGSWRAVWAYSKKRAARDNQALTAQANRARAVIAGEKQPRRTRFVTVHQGDQVLDEASIARARSLVGLKGYVTFRPRASDGRRRGRLLLPRAVARPGSHSPMSKHDLRARPIFHHTRDAIEAHLTVVMASLAVARYIQDTTGISIARIVRELRSLQEVTINLNGHHLTAADPLPPSRRHPRRPQHPNRALKTVQLRSKRHTTLTHRLCRPPVPDPGDSSDQSR